MLLKSLNKLETYPDNPRIKLKGKKENIEELSGKLKKQKEENKFMNSVLENDQETINNGKVIKEAINQGLSSFTPDLMMENLVRNYNLAKKLYGPKLLRLLSGYDPEYIERNIKIPEFQRELKRKLEDAIAALKKQELLDKEGHIEEKSIDLAALILYTEELDKMKPKGMKGERMNKKLSTYGEKQEIKNFKKGDKFKDIALKSSIKSAIRRNHAELQIEDLKTFQRQSKGTNYIIYILDASGSMRGDKIDMAKKAGVALAYKAIQNKDKVGLITFGKEVKSKVFPTDNFMNLLKEITKIRASTETDITTTLKEAQQMFPRKDVTKHIIILSDALPTIGAEPEKETLNQVTTLAANKITISIIGLSLDKKGIELATKIAELGRGRFYTVNKLENMDTLILEDYYNI